jgi:hypothetical protein
MGHDAEILEVEDPDLSYDAETSPYQQPQRGGRPTCRTGLLEDDVKTFVLDFGHSGR